MKKASCIFLLAAQAGGGQTTIACNLGAAQKAAGKNVLLISCYENPRLRLWNEAADTLRCGQILPGNTILPDYYIAEEGKENLSVVLPELFAKEYDVFYILMGNTAVNQGLAVLQEMDIPENSAFLVCTTLEKREAAAEIKAFLQHFQEQLQREMDLLVPNKLQVREWENNSRQLMELGDWLGYEKIADMLPECSRIRELPLDHKSVWQVPVDQMRWAFRKLLHSLDAETTETEKGESQ